MPEKEEDPERCSAALRHHNGLELISFIVVGQQEGFGPTENLQLLDTLSGVVRPDNVDATPR